MTRHPYVILGGKPSKWDSRELDYMLVEGDPVNCVIGISRGAPVYEVRVVKGLTLKGQRVMVETVAGRNYCILCDSLDSHEAHDCPMWSNELLSLPEQQRREAFQELSAKALTANWTRQDWQGAAARR